MSLVSYYSFNSEQNKIIFNQFPTTLERPKFFPYKYINNYRRSYYDNVVDVIERRRKGLRGTIPRPQTWAERILRVYNEPYYKIESFDRYLNDIKLVTKSEISGRFYKQYNIENFNKRYSRLVY